MNLPTTSEEVFREEKKLHVGNVRRLRFFQLVLSLISVSGQFVLHFTSLLFRWRFSHIQQQLNPVVAALFLFHNSKVSAASYSTFQVSRDASCLRSLYGKYDLRYRVGGHRSDERKCRVLTLRCYRKKKDDVVIGGLPFSFSYGREGHTLDK